jgi:hypothetical protein
MKKSSFLISLFLCFVYTQSFSQQKFFIANGDVAGLVSAINQANANIATQDTIFLAANGLYTITTPAEANVNDPEGANGPNGLPHIAPKSKLVIMGNGATLRRASTSPKFRLMFIGRVSVVHIYNLTFENGVTTYQGGGLCVSFKATTLIKGCKFINNITEFHGRDQGGAGLTFKSNGSHIVDGCEFTGNYATDSGGGGLSSCLNQLTVKNCKFINNKAWNANRQDLNGGGLYIDGSRTDVGTIHVENCLFEGNESQVGSGFYLFSYNQQKLFVDKCTFRKNRATTPNGQGAGMIFTTIDHISNDPDYPMYGGPVTARLTLTNSVFYENTSNLIAGGLLLGWRGFADVRNCTFANNRVGGTSGGTGGGVAVNDMDVTLTNCTIAYNYAGNVGGGIGFFGASKLKVYNSIMAHNVANNNNNRPEKIKDNCSKAFIGTNNIEFPNLHPLSNLDTPCTQGILFADPKLGPLQDNGGGILTMAIGAGSPAIDAGIDYSFNTTDQRGFSKTGKRDIGAFEYNAGGVINPDPDPVPSKLIEAENNYQIIQDIGANLIKVISGTVISNGKAVRISDTNDQIAINFNITVAGNYYIKVMTRAGGTLIPSTSFWPTGYSFSLDGNPTIFEPQLNTLTSLSTAFGGGSYWGIMQNTPIAMAIGNHTLLIATTQSWGGIDYIEIVNVPITNTTNNNTNTSTTTNTALKPQSSELSLLVYPNPLPQDVVNLRFSDRVNAWVNYELMDGYGKKIKQGSFRMINQTDYQLDLRDAKLSPQNNYMLVVKTNNLSKISYRLVKD